MKKLLYILLAFAAKMSFSQAVCTEHFDNVFIYNLHTYKIVKELKTQSDAVSCATNGTGGATGSGFGYLVHIEDSAEQTAVYNAILSSGISTTYHPVADGGGTSYIWIGASDIATEGTWLWDGNNDGIGTNFWNGQGAVGTGVGSVVGGTYNNWGTTGGFAGANNEPDNYAGNQDAAAIALEGWPAGGSSYGGAGQWNDIDALNTLYFIIEWDNIFVGLKDISNQIGDVNLFPNPTKNDIEINTSIDIKQITLTAIDGKFIKALTDTKHVDLTGLSKGMYFLTITTKENNIIVKKIIKE